MFLKALIALIEQESQFKALLEELEPGRKVQAVTARSARPYVLGSLAESLKTNVLVVTSHSRQAEYLSRDIANFTSLDCLYFPPWEIMPGEAISPSPEISGRRLSVLHQLKGNTPVIVVSGVSALLQRFPPFEPEFSDPLELKTGNEVDLDQLVTRLLRSGYSRSYLIESRGQFSVRGGLIDIFPSTAELPVRLELFGDRIESIRQFLVAGQRSVSMMDRASIYPASEIILTPARAQGAVELLKQTAVRADWLQEDLSRLQQPASFEGIERYLPFLFEKLDTLPDYFSPSDLIVIDEPLEVAAEADRFYQAQDHRLIEAIESGHSVRPPQRYCLSLEELSLFGQHSLSLTSFPAPGSKTFDLVASAAPSLLGKLEELSSLLRDLQLGDMVAIFFLPDQGSLDRLAEVIFELGFEAMKAESGARLVPGKAYLAAGELSQGFVFPELKLAVLAESDIFLKRRAPREKRTVEGLPITAFFDLKPGDYVVHLRHGIGRFAGLTTQDIAGTKQEYLVLEYAEGDKLYVPTDQVDRVSKFLGVEGTPPKISRLGSSDWQKTRNRVRKSIKQLAIDLLKLYAIRGSTPGFAFSPDTVWQKELEDSFAYPETKDQIRAIDEVKEDMEKQEPMDRLICGDVGYGKTEVAIRASFKAVMDNKQAIVLVPTTILAQQHFNTFGERLASFPVIVEMLSRFRSRQEQRETLKRFAEGKVDILIGTHRLLQKDVQARDLGLVVIDEEQRFGVGHKEHLRNLRVSADVLTMSATPIPRTLQMSLGGVRDLSLINTPPEERQPVITKVSAYDEETIKMAIERELQRDGQIYFVHNRMETIDRLAQRVRELVPEAKVGVAHGQMSEHRLEKIMLDFLAQGFDVLVCTTIIESGIDIPTANTLIVDEVESLGLSQMYQLRGRVGRARHRAYAYFFYTPGKILTQTALDRLKTIAEFTELSSGLKIALRDLEIRGAGNLLGPEQHGLVQAVGFDLYCEMLHQAIAELKGQPPTEEIEVRICVPANAFIPRDYITDETARLETYRRIAAIRSSEEANEVEAGLADIYGDVPPVVKSLTDICRLKILASDIGIGDINWQLDKLTVSGRFSDPSFSLFRANNPHLNVVSRPHKLIIFPVDREGILNWLFKFLDDIIPALINAKSSFLGKNQGKGTIE